MRQNELDHIPTKLVSKLSGGLDAKEYVINFKNGEELAILGTTSGSSWHGIATFAKREISGNRQILSNTYMLKIQQSWYRIYSIDFLNKNLKSVSKMDQNLQRKRRRPAQDGLETQVLRVDYTSYMTDTQSEKKAYYIRVLFLMFWE